MERRVDISNYTLFAPVFFASIGLKTDISGLPAEILLFSVCFVVIALVTKIIGCGLAEMCKRDRYSPLGNNDLQKFLESQDCEVNFPGLMGFVQYCAFNMGEDHVLYGGKLAVKIGIDQFLNLSLIHISSMIWITPPCSSPRPVVAAVPPTTFICCARHWSRRAIRRFRWPA